MFEILLASLSWDTVALAAGGMFLGIFFGALPGFGGGSAMALCLPLAIAMSPINAMVFLINVYGGTHYGGGIPAIMIGVPGDAGGSATVIDGFPMTRKGQVSDALAAHAIGSFSGGAFSVLAFIVFSPLIASIALRFGPPEFFVLILFGLTILAAIDPSRFWKGLFAGVIGMLLASVGVDGYWGELRYTFDVLQLYEGIPFIPALLGLFCVSQMLALINDQGLVSGEEMAVPTFRSTLRGMARTFRQWPLILQSTAIGTFIGALPGAGATIAAFVSYTVARATSSRPEEFGKGIPEGVIAPEAANSSNVGGALVPTFALGIPGSGATAVLLGVMMLMGLRPGPTLFTEQLPLMHALTVYLLFGCLLIGVCGAFAAKYFYRITRINLRILIPCTIVAASLGAYSYRSEVFDVGVMLVLGALGFVLMRFRYPLSAVVLGLVLGPMAETYFVESMELANWDPSIFFTRPICLLLWVCIAGSLVAARLLALRVKRIQAAE